MESSSGRRGAAREEEPLTETRDPLRVGVVGVGAMGRHHVRILAALPRVELVGVHDRDRAAGEAVAAEFGSRAWTSLEELAERCEAAVVAVPTVEHAEVGVELLRRGVHLLVEKPLSPSLAEADRLLEEAAAAGRVLAVGHVEYFNPAVQRLLALGSAPRFIEVERLAAFTPRSLDVDVVLDLMIHDLQIVHALDPSPLAEVRATGINVLSPRCDIASARIELESGCVANVTASRVSAEKVRKLRVFLFRHYYSLDYQLQEIKGLRLEEGDPPAIRREDLAVERVEPLRAELESFVAACRGEPGVPPVDGARGRQALATALAVAAAIG